MSEKIRSSLVARFFLSVAVIFALLLTTRMASLGLYANDGGLFAIGSGFLIIGLGFYLVTYLFTRRISQVFRAAITLTLTTVLIGASHAEKMETIQKKNNSSRQLLEIQKKVQSTWVSVSVATAGCDEKILANDRQVYATCLTSLNEISQRQLKVLEVLDEIEAPWLSANNASDDKEFREFVFFIKKGRALIVRALLNYTESTINLFMFLDKNYGSFSVKGEQIQFESPKASKEFQFLFQKLEEDEETYNRQLKEYSANFSRMLKKVTDR